MLPPLRAWPMALTASAASSSAFFFTGGAGALTM
jgi:hypothetical protein